LRKFVLRQPAAAGDAKRVELMPFDKWALPLYDAAMNTTVTLDKAGRVVIPKTLRDELHLEPGDKLELESEGERVTLRPVPSASPLRKERGVWVFRSGSKLSAVVTDKALRDIRDRRDRENRGHD
jgi:AbrB family looped-hinge helix DNA binding protein